MKRILALLLLFSAASSFAQSITFYTGSWADAQKKAKAQNKYILMDCYTDWCSWCKVMDKKTFPDASVVDVVNKNFFAVKEEMEHGEGIDLAMKYLVAGFPTYLIFNPDGKLVYRTAGYQEASAFVATLNKALDPTTQMQFPGIGAAMDPGYPDFYKKAFDAKKRAYPTQEDVTAFLDKQSDKFSEVSWAVMWRFDLNETWNNWFLQHNADLSKKFGSDLVNDKVMDIIRYKLKKAADANDESQLNATLTMIDQYIGGDNDMLKLSFRLGFYQSAKNWKSYAATYQAAVDSGWGETSMCNNVSWALYESCDDDAILKQATGWMKDACEKAPMYMYIDTYAALLYKTKNYTEARVQAEKAIATGKASGEDVKGTEDLLEYIKAKGF